MKVLNAVCILSVVLVYGILVHAEEPTPSSRFQALFFDPENNGVELPPQSMDYEISTAQDELLLGNLSLPGSSVSLVFSQVSSQQKPSATATKDSRGGGRARSRSLLSFHWPSQYLATGRLEIVNDRSRVLWAKEIRESDVEEWQKNNVAHGGGRWGLVGKDLSALPLSSLREPFRFCLIRDSEEGRRTLCSRRYSLVRELGRYAFKTVSARVRPRALVNDRQVGLKGTAIFADAKTPMRFAALLPSGTYFEFMSSPKEIHIIDLVKTSDGKYLDAVGYGHIPQGEVETVGESNAGFWSFLNFMPTIGDRRKFWRIRIPYSNPNIYFHGSGGVPYRQELLFEDLPSLVARPQIEKNAMSSTYNRRPKIKGRVSSAIGVSSQEETAVKRESVEPGWADFEWTYAATRAGEVNRSLLLLTENDKVWKAYHEVFRAYPRELGLRLTGVLSNDMELIFLGEVAGQWWFESLFGWENSLLSYQRWGVSAKYFQSLTSTGGKKDSRLVKLQVTNFDLKYRLSPGVWGRDPSLGLMLNAQSVVFEQFEAQMAGGGIFWARSMPRFLDQVFNWIPFFDYPKWVDVDFIYYPLSLTPQVELGLNIAVNFHGKIQWGKQFYGEAGFGLKSFVLRDMGIRKKVGLGVGYGTLGLGYNF